MLSLGALSQLFSTGPQLPPPFRHHSAKQDRTESLCWSCLAEQRALRSVLFGRTEGLCSVMALRLAKYGRTTVLFGRTVPEGRGALRTEEGRCWGAEGAPEESRCREAGGGARRARAEEWRKGAEKEREDGREGAVPGRGKGTMLKRRQGKDGT